MAHSQLSSGRPLPSRIGSVVAGSTLVLTLSLFGLIAFVTGQAAGIGGRIPFYVLGSAVVFAGALVGLDHRNHDGRDLLVTSAGIAVVALVCVTLGLEGIAYALHRPGQAFASKQFLYLLTVALVWTGLGYWGLNHYRELSRSVRRAMR